MATSQSSAGSFPSTLDLVGPSEKISQVFGFMPGYFGALATVLAIILLLPGNRDWWGELNNMIGVACLCIGGPLGIWWEFRRRKSRTVLVPRSGFVGVYRQGQFVRTISNDEMFARRMSFIFKLRLMIFPLALGLIFLTMPLYIEDKSKWLGCGVGVLILIPWGIAAYSAFKLTHCRIKGYPGGEFLLHNEDLQRLFRT